MPQKLVILIHTLITGGRGCFRCLLTKLGKMQKKKALENLNNSMERNKDQLQDRIQKNEKETIEKLKRIISTISISASESFLKNNIDEKLHNRLIENSLSELPKKIQ